MSDLVVCSFHTNDPYYRQHGDELRRNLGGLGVTYVVEEVVKQEGQDWADLCRQKVPFLQRICEEHPSAKVFWIDADCRLLSLPDFVRDSTADIMGFQRGFSTPRTIGYHRRSRFWEPCFWGVAATPQARQMISDAAALEERSTTKATDDYFFEEGWRANANELTFQLIPSSCVAGRGGPEATRSAFFAFGSSGNVSDFKDKVVQHTGDEAARALSRDGARKRIVKTGKRVLAALPPAWSRKALAAADRSGLTAALTDGGSTAASAGQSPVPKHRKTMLNEILRGGLDGDLDKLETARSQLLDLGVPTPEERATITAALAFSHWSARQSPSSVELAWWPRPFPGNFGDWLSPLVVGHYTDARILYKNPTASRLTTGRHLVGVGSIGRFIKSNSVVIGTGISSDEHELDSSAEYHSVRGPLTAEHLRSCGGPRVESYGDPGIVLSRVLPLERGRTNGRTAFVRHFKHRNLPVSLPAAYDELEVLAAHPDAVRRLVTSLLEYDTVITSAMHVMIACQSYGIPCGLIVFEGYLDAVAGNGMKYSDYALGAGFDAITPTALPLDLREADVKGLVHDLKVSEAKMDEVEEALRRAVTSVSR